MEVPVTSSSTVIHCMAPGHHIHLSLLKSKNDYVKKKSGAGGKVI